MGRYPSSGRGVIGEVIKFALIAFVIVVPVRLFVAQPFIVSGASMIPTFEPGEYLVIDELSYRVDPPQRGEVIVFRYPLDSSVYYVKRIIGLPGETVEVKDGTVLIKSGSEGFRTLTEPYRSSVGGKKDSRAVTLDADEYFVMGDNRDQSADSRVWGPLQDRFIIGRAFARLYPFSEAELLPGEYRFE